jgi:hypothetical protein
MPTALYRRGRKIRSREYRETPASRQLVASRYRARLQLRHVAAGLDVHPRTVRRWELGETSPTKTEWVRIVSYFAAFVPRDAVALALAADVPSPFPVQPAVDQRAIEDAILRAADTLDVAPRRVREAVRDITRAVASAHGSLEDLSRSLERQDHDATK